MSTPSSPRPSSRSLTPSPPRSREEFAVGAMIEDQPGFQDPAEAGQVNRAFRVVARTALQAAAPPDVDLAALLSASLTRLARRRSIGGGLEEGHADVLLKTEPGRDDWLIYFLLTPWSEIERLRRNADADDDDHATAPPPA